MSTSKIKKEGVRRIYRLSKYTASYNFQKRLKYFCNVGNSCIISFLRTMFKYYLFTKTALLLITHLKYVRRMENPSLNLANLLTKPAI